MRMTTMSYVRGHYVVSVVLLLLLLICGSGSLFGQGLTGRVSGTVTDPSGAVVPGATVEVRRVSETATEGLRGRSDQADESVSGVSPPTRSRRG